MSELTSFSPDDRRWRAFAKEHATSPLQHPAWLDTLTGAYRLDARIWALTDSRGAIFASMPTIGSKLPWRHRWTSLPFTDTLEPVANEPAHRDALLAALARSDDSEPTLIRTHTAAAGWVTRQVGTVQVLDVSNGADSVLRGAHGNTRRLVKRAMHSERELTTRPITSRSEFLSGSLAVIARSRCRVGVPTQPRRYWSRMWELHERGEALTMGAYLGDALTAIGVFMIGRDHAVHKYSAAEPATRHLGTSYLVLASALDHLAARGVRSLDFGITDLHNTSLRRYKRHWGGEELPAYFSATAAGLLPETLEPGPLLAKAIQRAPVFVGRTVGSFAYPLVA